MFDLSLVHCRGDLGDLNFELNLNRSSSEIRSPIVIPSVVEEPLAFAGVSEDLRCWRALAE
jgi:hypothetical protein